MKKIDLAPIVFWLVLSLFFMVFSYVLGLGEFHNPGPGLFPFVVAACLFLVVCYFLISTFSTRIVQREAEHKHFGRRYYMEIGFVLATLFGYALTLEKLGYLITSALFLLFLFGLKDRTRWKFVILASILTTLISYFGFMALGVRFPAGILRLI
jgi:putative tricarboxylic transport membrane protein